MRRFGRALFWLFDAVIVAAFVCGYLAAYVHPATLWWLQPFGIILPYTSAAVVILAVLTAGLRWRKASLFHVTLVVLIGVRFGPGWLPQGDPGSAESTLSLVVFNTRNGGAQPAAGAALSALAETHQPDVLALQETWTRRVTPPRYAPFLQAVVAQGYGLPPVETARSQALNLPILGRPPLREYAQEEVQYWEDDSQTFALSRGVVALDSHLVVIYNVHLRSHGEEKPWQADRPAWLSPAFWRPYLRRIKHDYWLRAQQAVRIKERIAAEEHPVILVGDFNSLTSNWAYHHLADGMTDAFQAAGSGWGATYHRDMPIVRIDHVLLSPELMPVRAEVLAPLFSDHLPQIVEVAWGDAEDSAKTDER
ncbi:MAG: endonuclease/exonuclease/phosphatase family protein [Bacteroidota bacterium]